MMFKRQSGLGRGLGALIPPKSDAPDVPPPLEYDIGHDQGRDAEPVPERRVEPEHEAPVDAAADKTPSIRFVPVERIVPNPHQPRVHFDHQGLEDLVTSIKEHGIIQPLVVSPRADGLFELIAGERRLRAAKIAEFAEVPAIVRDATEQQKLELAIIENVQRRDLNPIEEARAYQRLCGEFNLTQDQVGERVGKSRPQVSNTIRLLELEPEIQDALAQEKISRSNARTLLSIPDAAQRLELLKRMLAGNFTVRQAEENVPMERRRQRQIDPNILDFESRLRAFFGLKVQIKRKPDGQGEARIQFQNDEDLKRLLQKTSPNGDIDLFN